MAKVIVLPNAEVDLAQASAWYEEQRTGYGEKFEAAVSRMLQQLETFPQLYQTVAPDIWRAYERTFKFNLLYFYSEVTNEVLVFAVFHASRDSSNWRGRLNG
ncbi:hypothetical protein ANRL2_04655 [Anaerolineae bacterium]|nr:hypothetical protein ANRL2_04655 [Anaerolineae bacterium]